MSARLDQLLPRLLEHEGGYVDHPDDPGGATNMGITLGTLSEVRGRLVTKAEVKRLTTTEAAVIYDQRYWSAIEGDKLTIGPDYAVFDAAVNSGHKRGVRWLQAALGCPRDGIVGPVTLRLAKAAHPDTLLDAIQERRMAFLRRLKTWPTFGAGWSRRVAEVTLAAKADIEARGGTTIVEELDAAILAPNPKSPILPPARPKQSDGVTRAIVEAHRHLLPDAWRHAGVIVLFVRGYYSNSFGAAGNDRGAYDDAAFLVTPAQVVPFNANADPSVFRRRVATLKSDQAILYAKGKHGLSRPDGGYPAWRQASDVTVLRDGLGEDRDAPDRRFWTNLHRGGKSGTSSLGCLTIAEHQWDEFRALSYEATEAAGQSRLPVILLEYDGNAPPVSKPEPDLAPAIVAADPAIVSPPDPQKEHPVESNPDTKKWWQSKGVIGALGAIVVPIGGMVGMTVSPGDVSEAVQHVTALAGAISGLLALIGRLTAAKKIG